MRPIVEMPQVAANRNETFAVDSWRVNTALSELEAQKPRVIENDSGHVPTLYCCLKVRRKLVTSPWYATASSVQSGSNNIAATCFQSHMCPNIILKLLHVGLT